MKVELPERFVAMDKSQKMPRRLRKIAVEKKRRERIDGCLNQIKGLLCKDSKHKNENVKMERAELLESVLQYIKQRQEFEAKQQQSTISQANSSINHDAEYRKGFKQCMREANQMVEKLCRNKSSANVKQYMQNRLSQLYVKSTTGQGCVKSMDRIDNSNYYLAKPRDMMCKNMYQIQNSNNGGNSECSQVSRKLEFSTVCRSSLQSNAQRYRDIYHNYIINSAYSVSRTDSSMNSSVCNSSIHNRPVQSSPHNSSSDSGYNTSVDVTSSDVDMNNNSNVCEPVESYKNMKFKLNRITKNSVQPNVWRPW